MNALASLQSEVAAFRRLRARVEAILVAYEPATPTPTKLAEASGSRPSVPFAASAVNAVPADRQNRGGHCNPSRAMPALSPSLGDRS